MTLCGFERTQRRLAALLALACGAAACSGEEPRPRNLLLISVDTLRTDRLGAYGYERQTSPEINQFAGTAVVFEDAHAHSSWTLPSFASLMTSLYMSTHGCIGFRSSLDDSYVTLAEILSGHGFHTGAVVSHIFLGRKRGFHQGFAAFDEDLVMEIEASHQAISSRHVTEKGVAWLRERASGAASDRWFLWLHYFDPHLVYQSHAGVSEQFGTEQPSDLYDGEIAFTDRWVGTLLDGLAEAGFADDTVVVFVSDHGEEFRDHGRRYHGHTLYRELVSVPLMIRAPGVAPTRVKATVRLVDVQPTLLDLLGLAQPPVQEGESLVPAMHGESLGDRAVLAELTLRRDFARSLRLGQWKLIENRAPVAKGGAVTAELYDVRLDPTEQNDVAAGHPDIVRRMTERLVRMIERAERLGESGAFRHSEALDLSERDLEQLRELGYLR